MDAWPSPLRGPAPGPDDRETEDEWHYVLVEAHPLPTVDLSVSVASKLAGVDADATFYKWLRVHYGKFVVLFRIATVLMAVTFVVPTSAGYVTTGLMACLASGSLHFSVLLMSWQLLLRVLTMQEFVFMSIINWANWATLASLFMDFRAVVCLFQAWCIQLSISSDVMFRTVLSASRSSVLALPLLVFCVLTVFLRIVDIDSEQYSSVRVNNINVQLADVFLNMSMTLSLLVTRNILRQRHTFSRNDAKLITCAVLKAKLVLQPATKAKVQAFLKSKTPQTPLIPPAPGITLTSPSSSLAARTASIPEHSAYCSGLEPLASPTASREPLRETDVFRSGALRSGRTRSSTASAGSKPRLATASFISSLFSYTKRSVLLTDSYDKKSPQSQQLRLAPTGLKIVDSRCTLVPRLTPLDNWPIVGIALLQATGLTGLVLMLAESISLDKPQLIAHDEQRMLSVVSFLTSSVFVLSSVGAMQTTLVRALARSFDVWMNMCQLLTGSLCLCAMVHWDQRCLVAVTISLWFAWIVTFDALTPRMRRRMGLTKRHAGVALLGVMASLLRIVVSLTFDEHNAYVDSEIGSFGIREGVRVEMRTKSFFLNRMFPLTVWAVRLLWELLWCDETELVFLKGSLEYFCPMEMLPLPKTSQVSASNAVLI